MLYEIVDDALGTSLRESLVVSIRAAVVGVRRQLDGDVGVLVEQGYQLVESLGGLGSQGGLVEVVEDVVDEHGRSDRGQRELQHVLLRL